MGKNSHVNMLFANYVCVGVCASIMLMDYSNIMCMYDENTAFIIMINLFIRIRRRIRSTLVDTPWNSLDQPTEF